MVNNEIFINLTLQVTLNIWRYIQETHNLNKLFSFELWKWLKELHALRMSVAPQKV